jgi:hypothetical protein
MNAKAIKISFLIILYCSMYPAAIFGEEAKFVDHILITGNWGNKNGEFGREELGKTELGYALDFTVYNKNIYVYDTMNNRIQVFDLNGKFIKKIALDFDWLKQGVVWRFAMLDNNFFALIGKPPYYSFMNADIYTISPNGKILKDFGNKQINRNKEEYFSKIIASEKVRKIYCSIGGSSKIAVFDFNGSFMKYLTDVRSSSEIIIDADGQVVKNAPVNYSWVDKGGNFYRIKSSNSRENNYAITTKIQIYNPVNNKTNNYQIAGDVKSVTNDKTNEIKYRGNFTESSFVDVDGNIYHFIALDDGIVLRRLEWKPEQ